MCDMHHNVCRYENLTFQTPNYLHKQYIFDTNNSQSEYAFLFLFGIVNCGGNDPIHMRSLLLTQGHEGDTRAVNNNVQTA